MNESREELDRLARRLCDVAEWGEYLYVDEYRQLYKNTFLHSHKEEKLHASQWLPLARIVAERDRLREATGRVEALADWWTEEMHRAKEHRQLAIAPEEILIEQRIDQLRAALEGK